MKDIFISYGRRESLGFVGRMHQKIKLLGYGVWFDKVNIPDGDDYALRISNGIEDAHNFVYVMAPRCMTSPYCLIEIEYARWLGKRIIPVNQMVIFNTEAQPLSEGDQAVLTGFYEQHQMPDQHIRTTSDVLHRTLQLLGRTDWLYARETLTETDINDLFVWQAEYENYWHKHERIDYLQTFEFPQFGISVDDMDSVVENLIRLIEKQKEYVHQHTQILAKALAWQQNQASTNFLPVGKERKTMEYWLLTEFIPPKQPPCLPNELQCNFICDARKNAENRMTDVFICYDSEDKSIRDMVIRSLSRYIITTWTHDHDIQKGNDFAQSIDEGIEQASNFFFFISPNSVQSEYCLKELAHALKYNKRIVPLLIYPTASEQIPDALRHLQYVDFTDNKKQDDYHHDIDDILNILRDDKNYFEEHKVLLARALKWKAEAQNITFLLRGHNLENSATWLRLNRNRKDYPPTDLHHEFILASESAKGNLGTEVFISYSRKDGDFARNLNLKLQEADKTTWFDQESISTGVDFEKEIYKGISSSNNVVFIISPDSVTSEYCEREVAYAQSLNKRFITILCRKTAPETMPEALRKINWIDFQNEPFDIGFHKLIQALDLDREHSQQHTILQQRAMEWDENNRIPDFLLNKTAYENAQIWFDNALKTNKIPPPTPLQKTFIQDTQHAIEATEAKERRIAEVLAKRLRYTWRALMVAMITVGLTVVVGIYAYNKRKQAHKYQDDARRKVIQILEVRQKTAKGTYKTLVNLGNSEEANYYLKEIDSLTQEIDKLKNIE